ncbi:MAG: sulfotransferase [Verrucomicrobiota bacterium]
MKPLRLEQDVAQQLRHVQAEVGDDLTRFPDFLILGPQRTGSSWLFRHLAAHPEVFFPREKETYYFSTLGQPDKDKYKYPKLSDYLQDAMVDAPLYRLRKLIRSGFQYAPKVLGDATASYAILAKDVIREICLLNPDIKALIMLRDPIERVRSHTKKSLTAHTGRSTNEVEFEEYDKFLRASGQLQKASYRQMIENWSTYLSDGYLMITEFRSVVEAPQQLLEEVLKFLGVEHEKFPQTRELEEKVYSTGKGRLPDRVEERIQELYKPAVEDLAALLEELKPHAINDGVYLQ